MTTDEQQQDQEQDYLEWCAAQDEYWAEVGREDAARLEQHKREEWQKMRDQQIAGLPVEWALDASLADEQQRRDARAGLDEWPGV